MDGQSLFPHSALVSPTLPAVNPSVLPALLETIQLICLCCLPILEPLNGTWSVLLCVTVCSILPCLWENICFVLEAGFLCVALVVLEFTL